MKNTHHQEAISLRMGLVLSMICLVGEVLDKYLFTLNGQVWLSCLTWNEEIAGSNPAWETHRHVCKSRVAKFMLID